MFDKIKKIAYITVFMLIIALPFYGKLFYTAHENTENKELAEFPKIKDEEGRFNTSYLSELSDYLNDNFAYRQELVTASALINEKIFHSSAEDMIVTGTDGWLYYSNTLLDYQGTREYSDRSIYIIKKNLELMNEYSERKGARFILTIPPNKNSLYSENMPYYYTKISDKKMVNDLTNALKGTDLVYVDLYQLFGSENEVLYHKTDSHWNNKGAALVHDALMDATGKAYEKMADKQAVKYSDFEGDLDKIYYPILRHYEDDYSYDNYFTFNYLNDKSDTTYFHLETENESRDGRLLMFRDSFGNTLTPFMANEYSFAVFDKLVPYRIDYIEEYEMDTCMFEIVERNLKTLLRYSGVFSASNREVDAANVSIDAHVVTEYQEGDAKAKTYAKAEIYENYVLISGEIDDALVSTESEVYIKVSGADTEAWYEASLANLYGDDEKGYDYGFTMYVKKEDMPEGECDISVGIKDNNKINVVFDGQVSYIE